ncbi:uncharacterized protein LOC135495410 [Lineus longissimus]|uniref:uncharacterized protein LOC135495410 n=1 Tax=Lineus longissimus TaxID=88925 RepID=UPI002B4DB7C7
MDAATISQHLFVFFHIFSLLQVIFGCEDAIDIGGSRGVQIEGFHGSRVEVKSLPEPFTDGSVLNIDFRTITDSGLIFFVGERNTKNMAAAYLRDGYILYRFRCNSAKGEFIVNMAEGNTDYTDGQWHKISITRKWGTDIVRIDNIKPFKDYYLTCGNYDYAFLGGLPKFSSEEIPESHGLQRNLHHSCIRNFQINTKPGVASKYYAVSSCLW